MVNFLDNSVEPIFNVGVDQVNFLRRFYDLVVVFLSALDLNVKRVDLRIDRAASFDSYRRLLVLHLEFVEVLGDFFVIVTENVKLILVLADSLQQLRVSRFTGEELRDDLLNIREACLGTDLLESVLDLSGT